MGWVNFLGESQSRIYPNMCATFGCGLMVVSKKKGGGYRQTDRQRDTAAIIVIYDYRIYSRHIIIINILTIMYSPQFFETKP